jgi:hypothetical protein
MQAIAELSSSNFLLQTGGVEKNQDKKLRCAKENVQLLLKLDAKMLTRKRVR